MRKTFVAGNWKMNTTRASAVELAEGLKQQVGALDEVEVGLCPPFVYLEAVAGVIAGSNIQLGGQNLHFEASGAFTAETSGAMLKDIGCRYVIVGHSERRHIFGEPDELIAKKVPAAFDAALVPILCVGETLEEREADQTEAVVRRQVTSALTPLPAERAAQIVLAYEPVWAIGTGLTATPEQAQEVHQFIRGLLADIFDERLAEGIRIQYGGSVKPDNAGGLLGCPDIDGALVGGASLKVDAFVEIIRAGAEGAA